MIYDKDKAEYMAGYKVWGKLHIELKHITCDVKLAQMFEKETHLVYEKISQLFLQILLN